MYRVLVCCFLAFTTVADAASLNTELVINGGAEAGDMSGWSPSGIEAVPGVGSSSGFGTFVFTGGTGLASQSAIQSIDVSANSALIDAGLGSSIFSINLQARTDSVATDTAEVTESYLDASDALIDSFSFAGTAQLVPDWDFFSDTRAIPSNTRSLAILLTTTRTVGLSSDGFFDEVSLQLTAVPVPAAVWLLGSGLCGLIGFARGNKSNADLE